MKRSIITLALALGIASTAFAAPDGAKLWKVNCAMCHGKDGKGGFVKLDMSGADFQKSVTDAQLTDATTNGSDAKTVKLSKKMPSYATKLSAEEVKALVAQMRAFGAAKKPKATPTTQAAQ
jgi:mono/diheme cytochrome c family protein